MIRVCSSGYEKINQECEFVVRINHTESRNHMIRETCESSITGSILNVIPLSLNPYLPLYCSARRGGLTNPSHISPFYGSHIGQDNISISLSPLPFVEFNPEPKKRGGGGGGGIVRYGLPKKVDHKRGGGGG